MPLPYQPHLQYNRLQEEIQLLQEDSVQVDIVTTTAEAIYLTGYDIEVEGVPIEAIIDCGSQSSIISRELLHQIGRTLYHQHRPLPALDRPMHKFSGKGGDELVVTAKTTLCRLMGKLLTDYVRICNIYVMHAGAVVANSLQSCFIRIFCP